jgi:DamX protein
VAATTAKEPAMAEPAQPAEKSKQSTGAPPATPPEVPSAQATLTAPPPPSTTKNEDSQTVKRNIRGAEWIKAQAAANYTLQLMAVKDENTARQFIEDHHLQDKAAYLAVTSKGQTLYAVVYGSYPQRSGAARAAKELPAAWGTPNPWIRSFKSLHGLTP